MQMVRPLLGGLSSFRVSIIGGFTVCLSELKCGRVYTVKTKLCISYLKYAPCNTYTVKKRGVTEHPRGAIFYGFRGNSMGYHGNNKILLPWGVQLHHVFYSVVVCTSYFDVTRSIP